MVCQQQYTRFSHKAVRCKPCQAKYVLDKARAVSRRKCEERGAVKIGSTLLCKHCGVKFETTSTRCFYCEACRGLRKKGQLPAYKQAQRRWADENREALRIANRQYSIKRREENPERERERGKAYYAANKEKVAERTERYRLSERGREILSAARRQRERRRLQEDPLFRLIRYTRAAVWRAIAEKGYTKRSRTTEILGCDWPTFQAHIAKQFTKGMCWEKIGSEIHLDHIVPLASAQSETDVLALSHFTNLRPLWAKDNLEKSDKRTHLI